MAKAKLQRGMYSAEQLAHWNACANDCRRGSVMCGDAMSDRVGGLDAVNSTPKLTEHRKNVLDKINSSRATRSSTLRLYAAEYKAALWLYEHDLVGKVGSEFYPLTNETRSPA